MKISKILIYISFIISLITIFWGTYLNFFVLHNEIILYCVSILLNIFSGAVILFVTSIVDYFINRKRLLEKIMNECCNYSSLFSKIEYFRPREIDLDENGLSKKDIEMYKNKVYSDNRKSLEKIMMQYINISDVKLNNLWSLYDDLFFLFDFRKKKKNKYYKDIFEYIKGNVDKIRDYAYHFKIYLAAEHGNYEVNKNKILELQNDIFNSQFTPLLDMNDATRNTLKDLFVSYEIFSDVKTRKSQVVYNSVADYLLHQFDEIGKDAYFNKKYNNNPNN